MRRLLLALPLVFATLPASRAGRSPSSTRARPCVSSSASASAPATTSTRGCSPATCRKHIPGNPTIIVQNQPGAGSLTMTNQLYAAGPFDGTVIGASFNGLPTTPLLQPTGARFEADQDQLDRQHQPRDPGDVRLAHRADARRSPISPARNSSSARRRRARRNTTIRCWRKKLFGWKFKVITGYEATPKIHLAMERGEVHGTWANWSTLKAINSTQWIEEKKIRILAQWALRKHPELPDVPLILELAKTEDQKQSLAAGAGAARVRPAVLHAAERAGRPRRARSAAPSTPP